MTIPFSSAVLLLHDPAGARPISDSASLTHALDYDARRGPYEEDGGCERDVTDADRELVRARVASLEAAHALDYDARQGGWSDKGAGRMEDASYWGQNGPLTREEIERDMALCGGHFSRSVISVDRVYAAELGLDTKEAMQELVRSTWQESMVAAGAAQRPEDIHWYACYHTDAENSLHVHISSWAADGRFGGGEGWHPSAERTRVQKGVIYRDAYAAARLPLDREKDYLRYMLPRIAKAEIGGEVSEREMEVIRSKAAAAGVECTFTGERTLDQAGQARVARKCAAVVDELREGRGLKSRNYKLLSAEGKVLDELNRQSREFARAWSRYRELAEAGADIAGKAVGRIKPHDKELSDMARERPGRDGDGKDAREHAARERKRFVDEEMKVVRTRVRNAIGRAADPAERDREFARNRADDVRHRLVTASMNPARNLGLDQARADRLRVIYQDALRPQLRGEGPAHLPAARAAEAAEIIARSAAADRIIREAASALERQTARAVTPEEARELVSSNLQERLADALKWRVEGGRMDPARIGHDRLGDAVERAMARDFIRVAMRDGGSSLGLSRSSSEQLAAHVDALRRVMSDIARGRALALDASRGQVEPTDMRSEIRPRMSDLSPEGAARLARAAEIIARSPAMERAVGDAVARVLEAEPGARVPDGDYVHVSVASAVEGQLCQALSHDAAMAEMTGREVHADQEREIEEVPMGLDLMGFAGMIAAQIARERGMEAHARSAPASRSGQSREEEVPRPTPTRGR